MICGCGGIIPIFQVPCAAMQDKGDNTSYIVVDGNRLEDILCCSELDSFAVENTPKCNVIYTLTQPPETWTGRRG